MMAAVVKGRMPTWPLRQLSAVGSRKCMAITSIPVAGWWESTSQGLHDTWTSLPAATRYTAAVAAAASVGSPATLTEPFLWMLTVHAAMPAGSAHPGLKVYEPSSYLRAGLPLNVLTVCFCCLLLSVNCYSSSQSVIVMLLVSVN